MIRKFISVFMIAALGGCCDMRSSQLQLDKELDTGDILAAIHTIENPCVSKIPHINSTKAMLMYRLSMNEKNAPEKARLKIKALQLLKAEADTGYQPAQDILMSYEKWGDAYFVSFPWGGLIGPSMPIGQERAY
jgi:hypothetical protein